jgi:hypothetical protein
MYSGNRGMTRILWLWAMMASFTPHAVPQQSVSGPEARSSIVTVATSEIVVDGILEEQPWNSAPKIGDLIQKEPRAGEMPSERTEVTLLRDANNLYIGVMCFDSEPDRIIGTEMQRDANLADDDRITIVLDTFRDQRSAFYFATNPTGALVDGLVFANQRSIQSGMGRYLDRTHKTQQRRVGGRVCDSLQDLELSRRTVGMGF